MIIRTSRTLDGAHHPVDGAEISCSTCPNKKFTGDKTHRPDNVIANHFRNQGWEVNKNGKDVCPECIRNLKLTRHSKHPARVYAGERERLDLTPNNIVRVVTSCGLPKPTVTELEHRDCRKFELAFPGNAEIHMGVQQHAETEIEQTFGYVRKSSYNKPKLGYMNGGADLKVSVAIGWYLTLEKSDDAHAPV